MSVVKLRPSQTPIACPFSPTLEGCALGISRRAELAGRIIEYQLLAGRNEAREKKTIFLGPL